MQKTNIINSLNRGQYRADVCEDGSLRIHGPGINNKYGYHLPPRSEIMQRYEQDMQQGRMSQTVRTWLSYQGIIQSGKRSITEGKKNLALPTRKTIPLQGIKKKIKDFWPEDLARKVCEGKMCSIRRVSDFEEANPQEYHSASNTHGGFRRIFVSLGPPYSKLYPFIARKDYREFIDPVEVGEKLYRLWCQGQSIIPAVLKEAQKGTLERRLGNNVLTLTKQFGRKSQIKTIAEITGLSKNDIESVEKITKRISTPAEAFVAFLFNQANTSGIEINGLGGKVINSQEGRTFYFHDNPGYADLRVGNSAVEVKSYLSKISSSDVADIIQKYTPGKNRWKTGEHIDRGLVVFLQPERTYHNLLPELKSAGIEVMGCREVCSIADRIISWLKENPHSLQFVSPRPNLDYLVDFAREFESPSLLMRSGNAERRIWTLDMLKSLTHRRADTLAVHQQEEHSISGNVVKKAGSRFLLIEKTLNDVGGDELEHDMSVSLESLRRIGRLPHLESGKALMFDIETCGLAYRDPIFLIGCTEISRHSPKFSLLFARDYSEERAILAHFLELVDNYQAVFTYNGTAFDLPRLTERARQNGLSLNGGSTPGKTLAETLGNKHVDLYPIAKKRFHLPDGKLSTVEKMVIEFERRGDIHGRKIPQAYRDFVYGIDGDKITRIINHNSIDLAVMQALVSKLRL